jgi:hypothetical protein
MEGEAILCPNLRATAAHGTGAQQTAQKVGTCDGTGAQLRDRVGTHQQDRVGTGDHLRLRIHQA